MSTPSDNKDNKDNKDKQPIKKKVNIKQNKIPVIPVNNANDTTEIIILATDKKDKNDKEEIPKKTIVRGGKKIKKADDTNYLRLPEDINTGVIDYSASITVNKQLNNNIIILQNKIKAMHQILWENEHMDGEEALNEIMTFIFLKYLGKFISDKDEPNKVDILNPKYTIKLTDTYDNEDQHNLYNKAVNYIKDFKFISKDLDDSVKAGEILGSKVCSKGKKEELQYIANAKTDEIINNKIDKPHCFKIIKNLLSLHPTTEDLFTDKTNLLTINNINTFAHLIKHINSPCFDDSNEIEDLIGEIYEYFLNKYNKKKSALGQLFTPRMLMYITIKYKFNRINDIIKDIAKPIIADKCMGTGGWLVTLYNMFKSANNNTNNNNDNINNNDNDVPDTNKNKYKLHTDILLHGREYKSNTYQYGIINLISTIGCYPHKPASGCSLTNIEDISVLQLNVVISNPPFKGKYEYERLKTDYNNNKREGFNNAVFEDIYFLKDEDNTPLQFLQLYIYTLADNGICMIVLPYGELFFKDGKSNIIRKNLLDKIDITDIILCPCGIFTHTDVKVCMLIFEKNKTGTKAIKFSKFNFDKTEQILQSVTHITTVSKQDILLEPICSFYHMDYLHDPYVNKMQLLTDKFEWVPFGDLFDLIKGELQSSKVEEIDDGIISTEDNNVILMTGAKDGTWKRINKQHNSYCEGENVFISENGNGNSRPVKYYNGKCNYSNLLSLLKTKEQYTDKINIKYIYHYLKSIQTHIETEYQKGSCNQSLDVKNFNRMKIPILPLERQDYIINTINNLEIVINRWDNDIAELKKEDILNFTAYLVSAHNKL